MSRPGERHAPRLGIEEAKQQVDDRRLPSSARPDERDALPGLEPDAEAVERGKTRRADTARERPRARPPDPTSGAAAGSDGIDHLGLPVDELEHSPACGECRRQLARRRCEGLHTLERGERQQGKHRDQHAIELAGSVRLNRDCENTDDRDSGD